MDWIPDEVTPADDLDVSLAADADLDTVWRAAAGEGNATPPSRDVITVEQAEAASKPKVQ